MKCNGSVVKDTNQGWLGRIKVVTATRDFDQLLFVFSVSLQSLVNCSLSSCSF